MLALGSSARVLSRVALALTALIMPRTCCSRAHLAHPLDGLPILLTQC
jgi:hypothetical protein